MKRYFLLLFSLFSTILPAQEERASLNSDWELFPREKNFKPLIVNLLEARIGLLKFSETQDMRVDVGNSLDIAAFRVDTNNTLQVGIDFFAFARTTGAQGLRLQIDAIDGFFGGHVTYRNASFFESGLFDVRLRILHHSAHLVDGHYVNSTHSWIDNREPFPYTQDFGELTLSRTLAEHSLEYRYYGGIAYATLIRPNIIDRYSYFAGGELSSSSILGKILEKPTNIFTAYHLSITGEPTFHATHQVQAGIKFGEWNSAGLTLYFSYYNGTHMFGEYANERLETFGLGFSVEFR